jgi:LacI family transcriptional regulator, gluconate utilization system Gnt-I transcriptional repressor
MRRVKCYETGMKKPNHHSAQDHSGQSFPRMAEVANRAGVTVMTVSRALRNPEKVAPNTLKKIHVAIEQTGYVPNALAGALSAGGGSRTITALIPTVQHAIFADTITGLSSAIGPEGYHLLLGETGYSRTEEDALIAAFLARRPEGVILTGVTRSTRGRDLLIRTGVPVVETWELTSSPIDMVVGYSNLKAAYAMTEWLAGRGYKRIAFVSGPSRLNERARRREAGYRRALKDLGLPILDIISIGAPAAPRLEDGAAILPEVMLQKPDAIFFTSDIYAVGAIQGAKNFKISVPEKLGIAGFHDLPIASVITPTLTTVHVPSREIGYIAGRNILARIKGEPAPQLSAIPFTIKARESTR